MSQARVIEPHWPAPPWVKAYSTTRQGGGSPLPYHDFNLAQHVGDEAQWVQHNRRLLQQRLALPTSPLWLEQMHGTNVVEHPVSIDVSPPVADGSYSVSADQICVVLTADCLPVLMCNVDGTGVVAVHAGWRGLQQGVIEVAVMALGIAPDQLLVWLGPAIGPQAFEVGEEVRAAFVDDAPAVVNYFERVSQGKYRADIYELAKYRLQCLGVKQIYGGDRCTYTEADYFFSYRRDGCTGRQASLIWIDGFLLGDKLGLAKSI